MSQQKPPFRIGHGFDVHRFKPGDGIMLGGIKIPHKYSFEAHSDGDVLIHAVCDALLGAIAAGDIGQHFPDTDPAYAGIDSTILLTKVFQLVSDAGYKLGNIDITIIAQSPRLATYVKTMAENLAVVLNSNADQINIKATTTERLGYIGREEGIAVHCVVILGVQQ
ncbi:MAG: 2-C-methyl-D-erythritol 2,4-cyclodiphosphate synthase [Gammaproteobacteria bacterium]